MLSKKLTAVLVIATATAFAGLSGPARAQEGTQDDFMLFFKMKMIDADKDGMVSKKEFMAMMEKAYDMKAKAMGAKGGMITEAQMKEFLKSLYVGG
jgi:Ca2+-binding EF-hand superfamily protein